MGEPIDEGATETAAPSPHSAAQGPHSVTTQPTANVAPPKQQLGRYEIESVLGAGGMGVVYAAFDPELERRVALKGLPDARRGQSARERLLREARAMARLTHGNVVRVYEVDSVGGHDFVAMELVDGGTLADWIKAGPHEPDEIIARFVAAGRGLIAAHDAGVIHRDFKPYNVLVAKDGRILVTDFGLARGVEPSSGGDPISPNEPPSRASPLSGITETGSVLGTPAYMAPEQRAGETVTPAADQFAFCVALWEALTGARPYRGNAEELLAALKRGPAALDASKLPRRLRAPLLRGLDPDPAKRWPSMKALLAQIAPPARRWVFPVVIGGAALASIGAIVLAVSMRGGDPGCGAPALDPDRVWPAGSGARFIAKDQRGVARLLDRDLASWKAARATACKAEPKRREATLACLDGVLARMNAVVRAAQAAKSVHIDPEDLIEPAVCERSSPRLPRTLSPEYVDVFRGIFDEQERQGSFEANVLDDLDKRAKQDACARAVVWQVRGKTAPAGGPALLTATREAELEADRCGDDHMIATIALWRAIGELQLDPKESVPLVQRAETAVARVPTSDLQAKLEIMRFYEQQRDRNVDAALAHGAAAIAKLDTRGCIDCSTRVALITLELHRARATAADLEAVPVLLNSQRAKIIAAVGTDSSPFRIWEGARAGWLWSRGELDEAHDIFDAIRKPKPIPKARTVKVVVVDQDGHPVKGALVVAGSELRGDSKRAAFAFGPDAYQRGGTTDEHGALALAEAEPEGIVVAELGDHRSVPVAIADEVTLVLEPTSHLSGKVALSGAHPTTAMISVIRASTRGVMGYGSPVIAPVRSDGTFEVAGVLRRPQDVYVSVAGISQFQGATTSVHVDVDRPAITGLALTLPGQRTVHVLVRSTVNMQVGIGAVGLFSGQTPVTNVAEMSKRTDIIGTIVAQPADLAKLPAEVKALARKDDLYGSLERVPEGSSMACATGYPRLDEADKELGEKFKAHPEKVEVRCVPIASDTKVIVIEVPPFPRFD